MGRKKRSEKQEVKRHALSKALHQGDGATEQKDGAEPNEDAAQRIGTAIRVRATCPVCGMLPEVQRLKNSPYPSQARIQRFGGSIAATETEPMRGYMEYAFGRSDQEVDAALLYLHLLEEARAALLEVLPDLYADAGMAIPEALAGQDISALLATIPDRRTLLDRLLTEDTLHDR
ncbi:MAG: hypothetical protein WD645_02525 [Dehalococcoidia bacterium]